LNFIPNFLRKKSIPKTVGSQKSLYSGDSLSSLFGSISDSSSLSYTAAMRQQDVYACIRIKSESIGQLPVRLFSQDGVDKTEILSGVQYNVFTQRPNSYQTWQDFIETYVTSLETVGNFYAEIKRNRYNNVYV
jgi:phage portal protein BeeE